MDGLSDPNAQWGVWNVKRLEICVGRRWQTGQVLLLNHMLRGEHESALVTPALPFSVEQNTIHILIVSKQKKKNQFTCSNYLSSSLTSVSRVSNQLVGSYLYISVLLQNPEHADVKMSFRLLAARHCVLKWTLLEMSCLRENRVDSVVLINLKLKGMLQQIFFSFSMTAVSSVCANTRQEIVNFSPHSV